jgi:peptidoglycan/LPS O-acetylase OafA/YrhL
MSVPLRSQLRALTGLRFIAALHVVIFHCTSWESWDAPRLVRNMVGSGYVAVSLFFVLSGFILTYAHAGKGARPLERNRFYLNRFARIYPAYVFALALVAPFFVAHTLRVDGVAVLFEQAIPVVTLLQAWWPAVAMAWNPPGWSLSAEAFFYALFPLVAPALVASRRSVAWGVGAACYAYCLAVPLVYLQLAPDGPIDLAPRSMTFWLSFIRYNPAVRFPEFVIGIVFARWYLDARAEGKGGKWAALGSVIAVVVLLAVMAQSRDIPYPVLHNGLLAPVFALLIVSLAAGRGPIAAFLATRPLVALGDASYSLYVLHLPLAIIWSKAVTLLVGERVRASAASTAAFVLLAVVASLLCHRYVELPMRGVVLRRWTPREAPRAVSGAPDSP